VAPNAELSCAVLIFVCNGYGRVKDRVAGRMRHHASLPIRCNGHGIPACLRQMAHPALPRIVKRLHDIGLSAWKKDRTHSRNCPRPGKDEHYAQEKDRPVFFHDALTD
jgi:hypothetical protein